MIDHNDADLEVPETLALVLLCFELILDYLYSTGTVPIFLCAIVRYGRLCPASTGKTAQGNNG